MFIPPNGRFTTHTRRMRFSGPLTGVICKRPFPEFVAKIRIRGQRSSADIYRSCEQNCNRLAAFKNATVRERPKPARGGFVVEWPVYFVSRRSLKLSRKN